MAGASAGAGDGDLVMAMVIVMVMVMVCWCVFRRIAEGAFLNIVRSRFVDNQVYREYF